MTRTTLLLCALVVSVGSLSAQQPGAVLPAYPSPRGEAMPDVVPAPAEPSLLDEVDPAGFQVWARLDYLLWWFKPVCLKPATLSVGSPADAVPGALGQPNTFPVLGDHKFEFSGASGLRPAVGLWLTDDHVLGIEAEGLVLEDRDRDLARSAQGLVAPPVHAARREREEEQGGDEAPPPRHFGSSGAAGSPGSVHFVERSFASTAAFVFS